MLTSVGSTTFKLGLLNWYESNSHDTSIISVTIYGAKLALRRRRIFEIEVSTF